MVITVSDRPVWARGLKRCGACLATKGLREYNRNRSAKDGRTGYCRPCDRAKRAEYSRLFPELDRAKKIAWRTNNPDRYRAGKYAQKKRERARKLNAETDGWTRADVLRVAVESDAYGCIWCHGDPGDDWQADHIYPLSRGGSDRLENIGVACQPCNSSKSNKLPFEEWTP